MAEVERFVPENEAQTGQEQSDERTINLPELPRRLEFQAEYEDGSEEWQEWMKFAHSEPAQVYMWMQVETSRVRDEAESHDPEYERMAIPPYRSVPDRDATIGKELFEKIVADTLSAKDVSARETKDRWLWLAHQLPMAAKMINPGNIGEKAFEELKKHLTSRKDLFYYFADRTSLRTVCEELGLSYDDYRAKLRPNWEAGSKMSSDF